MKVGKHAGMHGMLAILSEFGINPNKQESEEILQQIKQIADKGKKITDVELASVAIKQIWGIIAQNCDTGRPSSFNWAWIFAKRKGIKPWRSGAQSIRVVLMELDLWMLPLMPYRK